MHERLRAAILRLGKDLRPAFNRIIAAGSRVGDPDVFTGDEFPWRSDLEAHWPGIRKEFEQLLEYRDSLPAIESIAPDHERIAQGLRRWHAFFLYGYGVRSDVNCARCPETARVLDRIPGLSTAFFSVMAPGAHLRKHRGATKAVVTCHLALIVPEPREDCWIRINGRHHHWQEGRTLVFDDTAEHKVRNQTDQERAVLLLHVRRPVRFPHSIASRLFLAAVRRSPFISDSLRNQRAWEEAFASVVAARERGEDPRTQDASRGT